MRSIHFPGSNKTYTKPDSMTDEECGSVSTYEHKDDFGVVRSVTTLWMPNKEDIEAIMAGRPIYLQITGSGMPPVALFTCDEKGDINE